MSIQDSGTSDWIRYRGIINGERWELFHNDLYAVSSHGRIMRVAGRTAKSEAGNLLRPVVNKALGYWMLSVWSENRQTSLYIHRLIGEFFIGPCPKDFEINHKDGNKLNNRLDNLEYVKGIDNSHHALHKGLKKCKISESQLVEIRDMLAHGVPQRKIAQQFGITQCYVNFIHKGKTRAIAWENQ